MSSTTGNTSGEGSRKPTASGKDLPPHIMSGLLETEYLGSEDHISQTLQGRGVPSDARGPFKGIPPDGVEIYPLKPATWSDQSNGSSDFPEADEHGQGVPGQKVAPLSLGNYGYVTDKLLNKNLGSVTFTREQLAAIQQAEDSLTPLQRHQIESRRVSIQPAGSPSRESIDEGPSTGKGKSIDTQNWGAIDLDDDEQNIEVQKQILESFNLKK